MDASRTWPSRGVAVASAPLDLTAAGAVSRSARIRGRPLRTAQSRGRPDVMRLALAAMTMFSVGSAHLLFPPLLVIRPAMLAGGIALAYAFLNPHTISVDNLRRSWIAKVVIVLGVLAFLSVPFGISLGSAARTFIEEYSKVLVYTLLIIATMQSVSDVRWYIWAYLLGAAALTRLSLTVDLSKTGRGVGGMDAGDVALTLVVAVPLLLFTFQVSRFRGKLVSAIFLVGAVFVLARSESRGAFLGLLAVMLLLLFAVHSMNTWKRMFALVAVAITLLLGGRENYWELMNTLTDIKSDYNYTATNGRRQIAIRGMGYMLQYPVFGIGIGNFARAEGTISGEKVIQARAGQGIRWAAAHNSHVQIAAELGVGGAVAWTVMLVGSVVGLVRLRRRLPKQWVRGTLDQRTIYLACQYVAISIIGFAVSATFLSFAYREHVYLLMAVTAGVFLCARRMLGQDPPALALPRRNYPRQSHAIRLATPTTAATVSGQQPHGGRMTESAP